MYSGLPFVFQGVVKDLFSQFGSVQLVELRDHPGSFQESGPKLSRFFKPAAKQVGSRSRLVLLHSTCYVHYISGCYFKSWVTVCLFQGFKVGYIVFHNSSSIKAAKSHPHDVPLVVSTEQRPVRTGVQSE